METDLNLCWTVQMTTGHMIAQTSDQWLREVQLAAERRREVQWDVQAAAQRRVVQAAAQAAQRRVVQAAAQKMEIWVAAERRMRRTTNGVGVQAAAQMKCVQPLAEDCHCSLEDGLTFVRS